MDLKAKLRRASPTAYRTAIRLRHGPLSQKLTGARRRSEGRRLFATGSPVTVEIATDMGLGGVLENAGRALLTGQTHDVDVALRFTAPAYAPSWGARDWLDCYFDRLGSIPDRRPVCYDQNLPNPIESTFADRAALVWRAVRIRADFVREANELIGEDIDFAAVHFRGSDGFVHAPRADTGVVLDTVEREMHDAGLRRLFVASDEPSFVALASERYGEAAFWLPVEAFATDGGTPSWLSDVSGEVKAREALVTMVVLSRARLLVRTESLLSQWATTLAEDQRVVTTNKHYKYLRTRFT